MKEYGSNEKASLQKRTQYHLYINDSNPSRQHCMSNRNVTSALRKPNGMRAYLNFPNLQQKAVNFLEHSDIEIWWKPFAGQPLTKTLRLPIWLLFPQ